MPIYPATILLLILALFCLVGQTSSIKDIRDKTLIAFYVSLGCAMAMEIILQIIH